MEIAEDSSLWGYEGKHGWHVMFSVWGQIQPGGASGSISWSIPHSCDWQGYSLSLLMSWPSWGRCQPCVSCGNSNTTYDLQWLQMLMQWHSSIGDSSKDDISRHMPATKISRSSLLSLIALNGGRNYICHKFCNCSMNCRFWYFGHRFLFHFNVIYIIDTLWYILYL